MMTTNTIPGKPEQPLRLEELSKVLMNRERVAYGFFLSQALWEAISARFVQEGSDPLAPIPTTLQGVRTAVDPTLAATEFNVAFTADAWHKRLRELRPLTSHNREGSNG